MNSFLIKLGKAYHTIERQGFFGGVKRVLYSLFILISELLKIPRAGDVLFISGGIGDSTRYRAKHVAEELRIHGFKCATVIQDNLFLSGCADKFRVFILHRTLFSSQMKNLLENLKAKNKEVIFETDDLVFDVEYLKHMDYWKQLNGLEKKLYKNGVGGEILLDPYVETCTTTTAFLADKLKEYNKKVFIVPNKLSNHDLKIAEDILNSKKSQISNLKSQISIGYFSGTISHNKDFATITDALMQVMEKHPQVELFLAGPLDMENALNKFGARVKQLPFVPRKEHFANIAGVDINVVPLELGNPFCESKSELKFFEAGIVGVPTVAVANQTFTEAIEEGVDGFLAGSTEEWVEKLSRLIESNDLRKSMGERARAKALQKYSNRNSNNEEYYNYLRECV